MVNRLVSVGDDFNLPAAVNVVDGNLPDRLQVAELSATILDSIETEVPPLVTSEVNSAVPPAVTAAIAADTTVVEAAADAVTAEILGRELVEEKTITTNATWAHVEIDDAGQVIWGIKTDGAYYVRDLEADGLVQATDARLAQPMQTIANWDTVELDSNDDVIHGIKTDGTYYFRKLECPSLSALPAKIAGYGDSMFGDHGSLGVSTLSALEALAGVEVHKGGVPGQTSTEAALRQGGLDVFVSVTGGSIPASGAVAVTVFRPTGVWKTGTAWTFTGSLADIPGTLAKAADDTWTFTRTSSGSVTTVKAETRWVADGVARNHWITLFRGGKNAYIGVAATVERDYKAVLSGLAGDNKHRFLALPIYNSTSEASGSSNYNAIMAINASLEATYGANYYDLRGWLIRNGLAEAGITPTSDDTTAIAEDRIPPSLMYDSTHLTAVGRQVEAARLLHIIKSKGWL